MIYHAECINDEPHHARGRITRGLPHNGRRGVSPGLAEEPC